jgi:sigma-B regulation protein RsbU (phosphoserine phosphatase)
MPWRHSFRTKLVLVAGVSVFAGLLLSGGAAYFGIAQLGREAGQETRRGLSYNSAEYLGKHIRNVAERLSGEIERAESELATLTAVAQTLIDHRRELAPLLDAAAASPLLRDRMQIEPEGRWAQNSGEEPAIVTAWGYLLDRPGDAPPRLRADVAAAIDETALLDLVMPPIFSEGSRKLQIYYVGPRERSFARFLPAKDLGAKIFEMAAPHNDPPNNFWDFFFPGLVDGWSAWIGDSARFNALHDQITLTPPYDDAAGGGPVVTLFQPLWTADRGAFAGALGFDLSLTAIIDYVEGLRLFGSGFAFLATDAGNVFAINPSGARRMGLSLTTSAGQGVSRFEQLLKDSSEPAIQGLALPTGDGTTSTELTLAGHPYVLTLVRLPPFTAWAGTAELYRSRWVVGFIVPSEEIYAALDAADAAVTASARRVLISQIAITLLTLALVMFGVILVSRRLTGTLVQLARAAGQVSHKNYEVHVEAESADEIGQLGRVFNQMVGEIRQYTANLEGLVQQRTGELERANREIIALNERLAEENLRMGAELDVARRLQLMVLPGEGELAAFSELDLAGFMSPADEVGGDYYDVLQGGHAVKIAIGDVTGHGLESGVLMLMVQTAVRTLLASDEADPRRFLAIINKVLYQNIARIRVDRTMSLALLDYRDGLLTVAGQHEEIIVIRAGGEVERVDTMDLGLPIGLEPEIADFIELAQVKLDPGDLVALYTDGITEAEDPAGAYYGVDRMIDALRAARAGSSAQARDALIADVMKYIGAAKIHDDITTLIIKRRA